MIVDNDTHINEPMEVFEQYLEEPVRSRRPRIIKDTFGLTRILLEGRLYPDPRLKQAHSQRIEGSSLGGVRPGAHDPQARLEDLDREGIDVQLIFGSLGLGISALPDPEFASALARACNDYYADFCGLAPDRLKCMATLPLQNVAASVREMTRAIEERGHRGITLPPNVNGKDLDHSDFYPIYEQAERLDVPIGVHWGNGAYLTAAGGERFQTHFMSHAFGHPFEQMIALTCLICGGVIDRFPRLRFAFLEAGCGWLPYWMQRLDEHYHRRRAEVPLMRREPVEYLRSGNCFLTTDPDEVLLPATIRQFGDDFILFASDYPHTDSKFPHSVAALRARTDLPESAKEKILGNGAKFLKGS
ncbi:MAG TPA: amidohydrolase family protein [Blastocatellia bacterium]|nr:amidohydrolase family protein [Blastocatellia bacterium]